MNLSPIKGDDLAEDQAFLVAQKNSLFERVFYLDDKESEEELNSLQGYIEQASNPLTKAQELAEPPTVMAQAARINLPDFPHAQPPPLLFKEKQAAFTEERVSYAPHFVASMGLELPKEDKELRQLAKWSPTDRLFQWALIGRSTPVLGVPQTIAGRVGWVKGHVKELNPQLIPILELMERTFNAKGFKEPVEFLLITKIQ